MLPELYLDFYEQSWKLVIINFNPPRPGSHLWGGREPFERMCCHLWSKIRKSLETLGLDTKLRFMCSLNHHSFPGVKVVLISLTKREIHDESLK